MCLLAALFLIKVWLASIVCEQSIMLPGIAYCQWVKVTDGVITFDGTDVRISLRAVAVFLLILAFLFAKSLLRSRYDYSARECNHCGECDCRRLTCRIRARLKPRKARPQQVIPIESPWTWDRLN